jgi:hypothetical protein
MSVPQKKPRIFMRGFPGVCVWVKRYLLFKSAPNTPSTFVLFACLN